MRKARASAAACSDRARFPAPLVLDDVRNLKDRDGVFLPEALKSQGIEFDRALDAKKELKNAAA